MVAKFKLIEAMLSHSLVSDNVDGILFKFLFLNSSSYIMKNLKFKTYLKFFINCDLHINMHC